RGTRVRQRDEAEQQRRGNRGDTAHARILPHERTTVSAQILRTSARERVADLSIFPTAKSHGIVVREEPLMIDGLKLTMTGEELRNQLKERIEEHERLVEHYEREAKREPDPDKEDDFVLPEHMCEYEVDLHGWRAE